MSRIEPEEKTRTPIWVIVVVGLWPFVTIAVLLIMLGPPAWR